MRAREELAMVLAVIGKF